MRERRATEGKPWNDAGLVKLLNRLTELIRALEEAVRTCKAANESQRKSIIALEAERNALRERFEDLRGAWERDHTLLGMSESEREKTSVEKWRRLYVAESKEKDALEAELVDLRAIRSSLQERLFGLEGQRDALKAEIADAKEEIEFLRQSIRGVPELKAERDALKARVAELESHICHLSEELGWQRADALDCGHDDILGGGRESGPAKQGPDEGRTFSSLGHAERAAANPATHECPSCGRPFKEHLDYRGRPALVCARKKGGDDVRECEG